jgi:hypothetical protein
MYAERLAAVTYSEDERPLLDRAEKLLRSFRGDPLLTQPIWLTVARNHLHILRRGTEFYEAAGMLDPDNLTRLAQLEWPELHTQFEKLTRRALRLGEYVSLMHRIAIALDAAGNPFGVGYVELFVRLGEDEAAKKRDVAT